MKTVAFFDTKSYDRESFGKFSDSNIKIRFFENKLNIDTVSMAKNYDAVCVFVNDSIDSHVVSELEKMGVGHIALRCSGYNNVDLKAAKGKIRITRVPSYSPYAIAEHAMGMILTLNRKLHRAYIRTRDHNFSLEGLTGFDLHGKTVGIIGTGKIGCAMAEICRGFGMKVLGFDPYTNSLFCGENTSLEALFSQSDIISLHCPLNKENYKLINKNTLEKCKDGVFIINTSRGKLVDTADLIAAIKTGKVGAAGLDVYEEETELFFEDYSDEIIHDDTLSTLISMPNVIVTSHQAFLTREALNAIAETTMKNLKDYFDGKELKNEICI